jgi:hypothetical protein
MQVRTLTNCLAVFMFSAWVRKLYLPVWVVVQCKFFIKDNSIKAVVNWFDTVAFFARIRNKKRVLLPKR